MVPRFRGEEGIPFLAAYAASCTHLAPPGLTALGPVVRMPSVAVVRGVSAKKAGARGGVPALGWVVKRIRLLLRLWRIP